MQTAVPQGREGDVSTGQRRRLPVEIQLGLAFGQRHRVDVDSGTRVEAVRRLEARLRVVVADLARDDAVLEAAGQLARYLRDAGADALALRLELGGNGLLVLLGPVELVERLALLECELDDFVPRKLDPQIDLGLLRRADRKSPSSQRA